MDQVEVIMRRERRRRYSASEKLAIVAASLRPGVHVRTLCDQHEIAPSVLYRWRREAKSGALQATGPFVPLQIEDQTPVGHCSAGPGASKAIEITLPNSVILKVDETIDDKVLRRIVSAVSFVRS